MALKCIVVDLGAWAWERQTMTDRQIAAGGGHNSGPSTVAVQESTCGAVRRFPHLPC